MSIGAIVDTVAQRLAQAKLSVVEDRARRYILWHFAETGRAPRPPELQRELQLASQEDAAAILTRLHAADLLVYDAASVRITAAYPFSSKPTGHRVQIGNRALHALCAIDALGIPFMLGASGVIRSECFWCHAVVEVEVADGEIRTHRPAGLVAWYPEKDSCGCVATSRCGLINFFCTADHLAAWRDASPGEQGTALSLDEAVEAGRIIFENLLRWRGDRDPNGEIPDSCEEDGMARQVILYHQPGWGSCNAEKEFLSRKGIPFESKDIRADSQALGELLELGYRATPVTVIDGEVVVGFDRGKRERLLGIKQGA